MDSLGKIVLASIIGLSGCSKYAPLDNYEALMKRNRCDSAISNERVLVPLVKSLIQKNSSGVRTKNFLHYMTREEAYREYECMKAIVSIYSNGKYSGFKEEKDGGIFFIIVKNP